MLAVLATVLAWSVILSPALSYADEANPYVRVRVLRKQAVITVNGFGLRVLGESTLQTLSALPTKKTWRVARDRGRWRIFQNEEQIFEAASEVLEIAGEEMRVDRLLASGSIRLVGRSASEMDLVVELKMDEYLLGVLPAEMPVSWPIEALKAQAVASRTYALAVRESRTGEHFHLDSTIENQVYSLSGYRYLPKHMSEKVQRAVNGTAGVYIANHQKKPTWAYFHSHCGGRTEKARNVWGAGVSGGNKVHTVEDTHCAHDSKATWQSIWLEQDVLKTLARVSGLKIWQEATLTAIKTLASKTDPSRVESVQFVAQTTDESILSYSLSGQNFRRHFGFGKIKSTRLELDFSDNKLKVSGHGNGHGVGMCQTGARVMAMAGQNYQNIIRRYYGESNLSIPHRLTYIPAAAERGE